MFVGRVANLEMQMSTMDVKVRFHKKPVAVNLTTVELPPIGDAGSFENPTVCRIDVAAYHNSCNVTSAESSDSCESYET